MSYYLCILYPPMSCVLSSLAHTHIQSIPSDSTKIRSVLGGWLYGYEIPPAPTVTPTSRADSPDEPSRVAKVNEVRRERAMSVNRAARKPVAMDTDTLVVVETDSCVAMEIEPPPDVVTRQPASPEPSSGLEGSDGFVFAFHRREVCIIIVTTIAWFTI